MQQLRTQAFLKERDGAADRGTRSAELAASGRQTAFIERRDEDPHCIDAVHGASRRAQVRQLRWVRWSQDVPSRVGVVHSCGEVRRLSSTAVEHDKPSGRDITCFYRV